MQDIIHRVYCMHVVFIFILNCIKMHHLPTKIAATRININALHFIEHKAQALISSGSSLFSCSVTYMYMLCVVAFLRITE